jgi:hypothetical protein
MQRSFRVYAAIAIALRLRFPLVDGRVITDPAAMVDDPKVSVG